MNNDEIAFYMNSYNMIRRNFFHETTSYIKDQAIDLRYYIQNNIVSDDTLNSFEKDLLFADIAVLNLIIEMMKKFQGMDEKVTYPHFSKFIIRMEVKLNKFVGIKRRIERLNEGSLEKYHKKLDRFIQESNKNSLDTLITFTFKFLSSFKPTFMLCKE